MADRSLDAAVGMLLDWRRIPRVARLISLLGIFVSIRVLLKYAQILPQSKGMAQSLLPYPSLFQHTILVAEEVVLLAGAIFLLKLWRASAVLFSTWFGIGTVNALYRGFNPSDQLLKYQQQNPVFFGTVTIITVFIELVVVVYVWRVTSQSGWFDAGANSHSKALGNDCPILE